jgi:hypothetical protein
MSDRRDNGPLRLPPEREVSPQLRARVLHEAMHGARKPSRRAARIGPIVAGLAAAAVVAGVVVTFNQGGDGGPPATRQGTSHRQVGEHDAVDTVVKAVPDRVIGELRRRCSRASGVEVERRISAVRLRSPLGRIDAVVFNDKQGDQTRAFCTPFGVVTTVPPENVVTAGTPVKLVANSRVQGLLPTRRDREGYQAYYDGAWFATSPGVAQIEARLVVDGEPQTWHSAERLHGFVFAAAWGALTDSQTMGEVTVEYRAISVDGTLMPMPPDVASSTVTPAAAGELSDRRDSYPSIER